LSSTRRDTTGNSSLKGTVTCFKTGAAGCATDLRKADECSPNNRTQTTRARFMTTRGAVDEIRPLSPDEPPLRPRGARPENRCSREERSLMIKRYTSVLV